MILEIDERWRIKTDVYCWMVQRKRTGEKGGRRDWKAVSYHATLAQACAWLQERAVLASDAKTLAAALADAKSRLDALTAALEREISKHSAP